MDSRLAALEGKEKDNAVTVNELAAKILELKMNTTPLPLPPPPAVPQVWAKRLEKLEVAEAVQDRPMQEKVKLDVRVSGLLTTNDIDNTPTVDLLSKVSIALGEAVALSGGEMGITSVRIHRVRAARGGQGLRKPHITLHPPTPTDHSDMQQPRGKAADFEEQEQDREGGPHLVGADPVADPAEEFNVGAVHCSQR